MSKALPHIIEKIEDWPINKFALSRAQFIAELNQYTYERVSNKNPDDLEQLLSKTIYQERQRVKINPWKVDPQDEGIYWAKMANKMKDATLSDDRALRYEKMLKRIINRYSEEIVGDFSPKTFRFARKFLRAFFKRVFNKAFGHGFFSMWGSKEDLYDKLDVRGKVEEVRRLFPKGTIVFVPTHYSNIDSILIGYAIDSKAGLPAFGFAAGLNLYDFEILAYYMNRLGAYRVDRRKKNPIYLEALKSYTSLSVIKGVNSIFFPGGTRSRTGEIDSKLKLGLLGSLIDAQNYIHRNGLDQKIIVVPMTLGYYFSLEADALIEQHLISSGREKYIRVRERSGKLKKIFQFLKSLYTRSSSVVINIGTPMDVFGNAIDENANSINENGQIIETHELFYEEGSITKDYQRETVYTRRLANKIVEMYKKENYILSSHLVAYTAFKLVERQYSELDLFGILRQPLEDFSIPKEKFALEIESNLERLMKMESLGLLKIHEILKEGTDRIIEHGIKNLGVFHPKSPLYIQNDMIKSGSFKLLYYYQNLLNSYEIEI